jgi:hypothetical protein
LRERNYQGLYNQLLERRHHQRPFNDADASVDSSTTTLARRRWSLRGWAAILSATFPCDGPPLFRHAAIAVRTASSKPLRDRIFSTTAALLSC